MYGKYKNPNFSLRINPEIMEKVKIISEREKRTKNKQIEFILQNYVNQYELEHGTVGE